MNHADKILKLAEIQTTDLVVRDHVNLCVCAVGWTVLHLKQIGLYLTSSCAPALISFQSGG